MSFIYNHHQLCRQQSITYMIICVIHAVCTMFPFVCLDNGNNVAARCVGHSIGIAPAELGTLMYQCQCQ